MLCIAKLEQLSLIMHKRKQIDEVEIWRNLFHFIPVSIRRSVSHFIQNNLCRTFLFKSLKGLGNILQIRENGAKVVTLLLDVQLNINWRFEWKQTTINDNKLGNTDLIDSLILPTILLQFNYILGDCKSSQSRELALYTIPDIEMSKFVLKPASCLIFMEKRLGKFKNSWENITVRECRTVTPSRKIINICLVWEFLMDCFAF